MNKPHRLLPSIDDVSGTHHHTYIRGKQMSYPIQLSAESAERIKELALRFSKELHLLAGQRIRGRSLYDAFGKPLGYQSWNEVINQTGRASKEFDYNHCFNLIRGEVRMHLPVLVDGVVVAKAMESAKYPGFLQVTINCQGAADESIVLLTGSMFYKQFKERIVASGREQNIAFHEILEPYFDVIISKIKQDGVTPIQIVIDYRSWKNERDPVESWQPLKSFIGMIGRNAALQNGVGMEVIKLKEQAMEKLIEVDERGDLHWSQHVAVIGRGHLSNNERRKLNDESVFKAYSHHALADYVGDITLIKVSEKPHDEIWKARQMAFLKIICRPLVELRDMGCLDLSLESFVEYTKLEKIHMLYMDSRISEKARNGLENYIRGIPGVSSRDLADTNLLLSNEKALEKHGYIAMQFEYLIREI